MSELRFRLKRTGLQQSYSDRMPRIGEGGQGFAGEDYIGIFADRERRLIAGGGGDAVGAEIFPLFVFIYDCKKSAGEGDGEGGAAFLDRKSVV